MVYFHRYKSVRLSQYSTERLGNLYMGLFFSAQLTLLFDDLAAPNSAKCLTQSASEMLLWPMVITNRPALWKPG